MKLLRFISPLVIILVWSCSDDDDISIDEDCVEGQGTIITETRELADFHSINSSIFANILLTQGPQEDVVIEAQQNILDILTTQIVNGELRITTDLCVDINQAVQIQITIPGIKSLTLTGVGDITAQNNFELDNLRVTLTGVGNFTLRGTTTSLNIVSTGVGDVNAFDLESDVCDVMLTGVSDAEVFVNDELNVTITGVGNVFYKGNPSISSNITGTGRLVDAN